MTNPDEMKKPTFDEPSGDGSDTDEFTVEDAMAVNSVPDEVRLHGDTSESDVVQRGDGAVVDIEDGATDPLTSDDADGPATS